MFITSRCEYMQPEGWCSTRNYGHMGPCACIPIEDKKKKDRIQELLEANNRYVGINRKLKDQLLKDHRQFCYYEQQHKAKGTADADAKALVNGQFAEDINNVLEECKPT